MSLQQCWSSALRILSSFPNETHIREVLARNGSAVDAAIAALFCNGLHQSSNMGPGGGFFMTIYKRDSGTVHVLNARERAPLRATEDMFEGNSQLSLYGEMII